jgi:hypothetical protein
MAAPLWTCALGFLIVSGPAGGDQAAAAQANPAVSLERVRAGLQRPPTIEIDATALLPVATFEEWLRELQRIRERIARELEAVKAAGGR